MRIAAVAFTVLGITGVLGCTGGDGSVGPSVASRGPSADVVSTAQQPQPADFSGDWVPQFLYFGTIQDVPAGVEPRYTCDNGDFETSTGRLHLEQDGARVTGSPTFFSTALVLKCYPLAPAPTWSVITDGSFTGSVRGDSIRIALNSQLHLEGRLSADGRTISGRLRIRMHPSFGKDYWVETGASYFRWLF